MNERIFRAQVIDAVAVGAGVVVEMSLPSLNKHRQIWCFYENAAFTAVGSEAWIRFSLRGEMAAEIPALVQLLPGCRLGMAQAAWYSGANVNGAGQSVLFWDNTGVGGSYHIHPFRLQVEADKVVFEHNVPGTVRVLLAVLSTPESA